MSYYSLVPSNISAYGHTVLPTLQTTVLEVEALGKELKPRALDFESVLLSIRASQRTTSGVYGESGTPKVDTTHRSSQFCTAPPSLYNRVLERLRYVVNYHVPGNWEYAEGLQFLCYDSKNSGHFSMHTDSAYWHGDKFILTSPKRKLTTVTYLNDDYAGGELILGSVLDPQGKPYRKKVQPGTMVIFPSDTRFPHEVTPVITGQRYSIVAWFDYSLSK